MDRRITLITGDITSQSTEAIVNAANSSLLGGGGVDGAIHRAGGASILAQCKQIVAKQGRCPTGDAVITSGGNLKAKYIIHTVGPIWRDGTAGEDDLLASAYKNSLLLAEQNRIKTISFPSISTGAYLFPIARAAEIAIKTVDEFIKNREFDEVRFVLFCDDDLSCYRSVYDRFDRSNPRGAIER